MASQLGAYKNTPAAVVCICKPFSNCFKMYLRSYSGSAEKAHREWGDRRVEKHRDFVPQSSQQKQVSNDSRNFYSSATCSFTQLPLGCTVCQLGRCEEEAMRRSQKPLLKASATPGLSVYLTRHVCVLIAP